MVSTLQEIDDQLVEGDDGKLFDDEDCCCNTCSSCDGATPATVTVDFGAGGLADSVCQGCNEVAGDIVVTHASCIWSFTGGSVLTLRTVTLRIVSGGAGLLRWEVNMSQCIGGNRATFQGPTQPEDSFDCTDFPVTLTKTFEDYSTIGGVVCTGTLPATITLEA